MSSYDTQFSLNNSIFFHDVSLFLEYSINGIFGAFSFYALLKILNSHSQLTCNPAKGKVILREN